MRVGGVSSAFKQVSIILHLSYKINSKIDKSCDYHVTCCRLRWWMDSQNQEEETGEEKSSISEESPVSSTNKQCPISVCDSKMTNFIAWRRQIGFQHGQKITKMIDSQDITIGAICFDTG